MSSNGASLQPSAREASQTPKLYDHPGGKKIDVWKYFGFIKAKDGPAIKTNHIFLL
jgi:hypothetical protein